MQGLNSDSVKDDIVSSTKLFYIALRLATDMTQGFRIGGLTADTVEGYLYDEHIPTDVTVAWNVVRCSTVESANPVEFLKTYGPGYQYSRSSGSSQASKKELPDNVP